MRTAVHHLIDHGHREISFIGNLEQYDLHERYMGYREALEQRGIPFDERLVVRTRDNLVEGGMYAIKKLLDSGISFTAVAAGADLNAFGVIDVLQSRGYSVPQDYAVIGFDDIYQASVNFPSLTTVRQPFEAMGSAAVTRVIDMLEGRRIDATEVNIPAQFIVRSSCACEERMQFSSAGEFDNYLMSLSQIRISLHKITDNNYNMTKGLILATKEESIHISNLFWNLSHWGCLALWEVDDDGQRHLVVRQAFSKNGDPVPPEGQRIQLDHFPPIDYLPPGTQAGGEDVVILHPVKSDFQNWGYIALAGPLDPLNNFVANDLSRHSFTILAVALERQMLFNKVRSIAEKLEIVSRTTNDGIWDWNLKTNRIDWNIQAHKILDRATEHLTDSPSSFIALVHPEEQTALRLAFMRPYRKDHPIQLEFRIRGLDESFIWVFLAGDVVWGASGMPTRIIGSLTDITEKKANEARIIQLAYQDALTGLPNRLLFKDQLQIAMDERMQDGKKLAVMMIDLDRFKIVNDTLGHQTGDLLLQRAAQGLKECVGARDIIARLGGDEFIVLLTSIDGVEEVECVADKMLKMLMKPFLLEGQQFYLSASIGACLYPMKDADADS